MKTTIFTSLYLLIPLLTFSQSVAQSGIVIPEYGKTYQVDNPDFKTDTNNDLKVVFDIGRTFNDSTKVNPLINTAARFLNMHVDAGVSIDQLKVALVIHGAAAYDILNNEAYAIQYGIDNPNTGLMDELTKNGVEIILCGQTAAYRNITKEKTLPKIQFALSAMTALVQLQNKNYRLINF